MSIKRQLVYMFLIVLLITLLVGFSGYFSSYNNEKEVLRLSDEMEYISTVREIRAILAGLHDRIVEFTLTNNIQQVERGASNLGAEMQKLADRSHSQSEVRQILHFLSLRETNAYLGDIETLSTEVQEYFEIRNKNLAASLVGGATGSGTVADGSELKMMQELRRMEGNKVSILKSLDKLIEIANSDIDIRVQNMQATTRNNKITIVIILAVAVVLGLVIPLKMGNRIAEPIIKLSSGVKRMGEHDLTEEIVKDAGLSTEVQVIYDEVESMRQNFIHLIQDITQASADMHSASAGLADYSSVLNSGSEGISTAVGEISQNAYNQANSTQDLARYFDNMNLNIERETEVVRQLEESNRAVEAVISRSNLLVSDLENVSAETTTKIEEIKTVLAKTNEGISMIDRFIETIDGISAQTNLLALNASIEAARVGEAGRGFAVVADEIRELADNSKSALEEMTTIISQIINDNDEVMDKIVLLDEVDSKQAVSVKEIVDSFNAINDETVSFNEISNSLQEITEATANGSMMLVSSVSTLTEISDTNATGTEKISSLVREQSALIDNVHEASSALAELAEKMRQSTALFRV